MATDVDTPSMAAYSAARCGRQSSKVGRLWHYNTPLLNVEAPDDSGESGPLICMVSTVPEVIHRISATAASQIQLGCIAAEVPRGCHN